MMKIKVEILSFSMNKLDIHISQYGMAGELIQESPGSPIMSLAGNWPDTRGFA